MDPNPALVLYGELWDRDHDRASVLGLGLRQPLRREKRELLVAVGVEVWIAERQGDTAASAEARLCVCAEGWACGARVGAGVGGGRAHTQR